MIRHTTLPTITIASDGTGSATSSRPVLGRILRVFVDFTSAGTPTTTISLVADGAIPAYTLLTLTGTGTDAVKDPRDTLEDLAGAAWDFGDDTNGFNVVGMVPCTGYVSATVASGTEAGTVKITVIYEE